MKKIFIALVFLFALPDMTAQIKNNLPDTANASYDVLSALLKDPLDSNILIVVNGISAGTIREIKKDMLEQVALLHNHKSFKSVTVVNNVGPL